ncbi:MAG: chromosome segregation protein SMC, partial [Pseudomonadota bacterium]
ARALAAEVQALAKVIDRNTATGEQLLNLLSVEPGYEKALGAALADDLRAPLAEASEGGWRTLPAYLSATPLPEGVEPLASKVTGPDALGRRLGYVGVVSAAEGAQFHPNLQPGQRLVSLEGDLWRWDGFAIRAADAPSAATLELEQVNKLALLREELLIVEGEVEVAQSAHDALSERLADLTKAERGAREARRETDQRRTEAARTLSKSQAERDLAASRVDSQAMAAKRYGQDATEARARVLEAERARTALPSIEAARGGAEDLKLSVEAARVTMMQRRAVHDEVRREGEARTKRSQEITQETSGWRHRLETASARTAELVARRETSEAELAEATSAPEALAKKRAALGEQVGKSEIRKSNAEDALAAAESALRQATDAEREAERTASEARETRARTEARRDAAQETLDFATGRLSEELGVAPGALLNQLGIDPAEVPELDRVEADVVRLKRQRDALGAVNLRAEEDARAVQDEHDTLNSEKADLEDAIRALRAGIASLNKEGRERLLRAFDDVNRSFGTLFRHLFGGGEANLVMVESEDPLDAGLEIMCQPPGKKLATLSLLSGGEQTLTALALIFAVFLANPAPICVLDEVDAPLDDANVTRFCDLLDEMTRRTQTRFLIITHHAVTMSRMDRLFGVTMAEQGVSQLVSVDLRQAEKLVA